MSDFWLSSGHHLLDRDGDGRLPVGDDFLRAWLARPELVPPAEACDHERRLHKALLANPREAVGQDRLARLADADARENWGVMVRFRDWLVARGTLEAALLALARDGNRGFPPMFVDQLTHAFLRGLLDGVEDPFQARAAELMFRSQTASVTDGRVLLADAETVEMHARSGGLGDIGRLIVDSGTPLRQIDLDVLGDANAAEYWARSDRFDMVIDLTFGRPGLDALARVIERWVDRLLGVRLSVQPVARIRDDKWVWHVGLDAEATAILNDLWHDKPVDDERRARILALFRVEVPDPALVLDHVAGRPIYLALAMDKDRLVRLKGQNLLVNLPLTRPS